MYVQTIVCKIRSKYLIVEFPESIIQKPRFLIKHVTSRNNITIINCFFRIRHNKIIKQNGNRKRRVRPSPLRLLRIMIKHVRYYDNDDSNELRVVRSMTRVTISSKSLHFPFYQTIIVIVYYF